MLSKTFSDDINYKTVCTNIAQLKFVTILLFDATVPGFDYVNFTQIQIEKILCILVFSSQLQNFFF